MDLLLMVFLLLWTSVLSSGLAEGDHNSAGVRCANKAKADIVLLVDGSGSISPSDFHKVLLFAGDIATAFTIGPDRVQIGLVQYSSRPRTMWFLNSHQTKHDLLRAITSIKQMQGSTMTGLALTHLLQHVFKPNVGMRDHSQKIVVLFTDGESSDNVIVPSQKLKEAGIEVFAIGVRDAKSSELNAMASDPKEIHTFIVDKFTDLSNIFVDFITNICASAERSISVRLLDGRSLCSGRLEVKSHQSNQSWSSVCEADFDQKDAEVVCRELGCGALSVQQGALYGETKAPLWTKEFQCGGHEPALLDCRTSGSVRNTCSPGKAVGLTCSDTVRLVGGASRCAGTLEVKREDWRPVHSSDWRLTSAAAVCEELDCASVVSTESRNGSNHRPAWIISSDCVQSGYTLRECASSGSSSFILKITCAEPVSLVGGASRCAGTLKVKRRHWKPVHSSDWSLKSAAVVCRQLDCGSALSAGTREDSYTPAWRIRSDCVQSGSPLAECVSVGSSPILEITCSDSVRLLDGRSLCSGRLEVKSDQSNQSWSSVCETDFDQKDAEVVCRELGCGAPSVLWGALYGEANAPLWTKEFQCGGHESALLDCRTSGSGRNTCSPGKAVGLTCSEPDDVRLVGEVGHCAGTLEMKLGDWRPVYGSNWSLKSAAVVCRQLDCGSAVSTGITEDSSNRPAWRIRSDCVQSGSALRECVSAGSSPFILEITCSGSAVFIRSVLILLALLLFIIVICFIQKTTRGQKPAHGTTGSITSECPELKRRGSRQQSRTSGPPKNSSDIQMDQSAGAFFCADVPFKVQLK